MSKLVEEKEDITETAATEIQELELRLDQEQEKNA